MEAKPSDLPAGWVVGPGKGGKDDTCKGHVERAPLPLQREKVATTEVEGALTES